MIFVSFSPHFPHNFIAFSTHLRRSGATVLGLADAPYEDLPPALKSALNEYYRVSDQHNYEELVRALGYFTHRYGKIDRLESHNEYWLETDARLRTDFNIPGLKVADMAAVKRKSEMKKRFMQAGIPVARGRVCHTKAEAQLLIEETGFPLVAKPDVGVGANKTYRIRTTDDLDTFFNDRPPVDYIFEEYIEGDIQTFDGLVDQDGRVVFSSSLEYNAGVMDLVNQGLDLWYYTHRHIPPYLEETGRKLVKTFKLRERFFHFEFFRTAEGRYIGLEIIARPPGGLTTDMWNYANDIDIYREYANVVLHNRFEAEITRPYYCAYVGRRWWRRYLISHEQILASFSKYLVHHQPISGIFAAALGDYGYLVRSPDFDELAEIASHILRPS